MSPLSGFVHHSAHVFNPLTFRCFIAENSYAVIFVGSFVWWLECVHVQLYKSACKPCLAECIEKPLKSLHVLNPSCKRKMCGHSCLQQPETLILLETQLMLQSWPQSAGNKRSTAVQVQRGDKWKHTTKSFLGVEPSHDAKTSLALNVHISKNSSGGMKQPFSKRCFKDGGGVERSVRCVSIGRF